MDVALGLLVPTLECKAGGKNHFHGGLIMEGDARGKLRLTKYNEIGNYQDCFYQGV